MAAIYFFKRLTPRTVLFDRACYILFYLAYVIKVSTAHIHDTLRNLSSTGVTM